MAGVASLLTGSGRRPSSAALQTYAVRRHTVLVPVGTVAQAASRACVANINDAPADLSGPDIGTGQPTSRQHPASSLRSRHARARKCQRLAPLSAQPQPVVRRSTASLLISLPFHRRQPKFPPGATAPEARHPRRLPPFLHLLAHVHRRRPPEPRQRRAGCCSGTTTSPGSTCRTASSVSVRHGARRGGRGDGDVDRRHRTAAAGRRDVRLSCWHGRRCSSRRGDTALRASPRWPGARERRRPSRFHPPHRAASRCTASRLTARRSPWDTLRFLTAATTWDVEETAKALVPCASAGYMGRERLPPIVRLAASAGVKAPVRFYLRSGRNPNATDSRNRTLLLLAAKAGQTDICRLLIESGADPTLRDADGNDAPSAATRNRHAEAAGVLRACLARLASPPAPSVDHARTDGDSSGIGSLPKKVASDLGGDDWEAEPVASPHRR